MPDHVVERIVAEVAAGQGWTDIARGLDNDEVATAQGGVRWYATTVRNVYRSALARAGSEAEA